MRYKKEEIEKLVKEYEKSGESKVEFGKGRGISVSTLNYLLRRNREDGSLKGFKRIEVREPIAATQILYPNGVRILLSGEISTHQLRAFLEC